MKSHRFTLETVLEIRRAQEAAARREFSSTLERQHEALNRCVESTRTMDQLMKANAASNADRFSIADRGRQWALQQTQEGICAEFRTVLKECDGEVAAKLLDVLHTHRNCELLERLKKRRRIEAEQEASQAEQSGFDELAMTRAYQAARKGDLPC